MKRYEATVIWKMIVPTKFSTVIFAVSEEEAKQIAYKAVKIMDFENWHKSNSTNENIYFEEYNEIKISNII